MRIELSRNRAIEYLLRTGLFDAEMLVSLKSKQLEELLLTAIESQGFARKGVVVLEE